MASNMKGRGAICSYRPTGSCGIRTDGMYEFMVIWNGKKGKERKLGSLGLDRVGGCCGWGVRFLVKKRGLYIFVNAWIDAVAMWLYVCNDVLCCCSSVVVVDWFSGSCGLGEVLFEGFNPVPRVVATLV